MKDSFVLYTKYIEHIRLLSVEQRGVLLTAIFAFASSNELPDMDGMTAMAFSFIRSQLEKDFEKYEEICRKRSEAGKQGGRGKSKKANALPEKQKKQSEAKKADNDNEYDNDNDLKKKNTKKESEYTCAFEEFWSVYPRKQEKAKAYASYKARLADGFSEDELMTAVKRYADECEARNTEKRYIKLCATFLSANTPFVDYLGEYKPEEKQTGKVTKFSNFQERKYDMGSLENALIER